MTVTVPPTESGTPPVRVVWNPVTSGAQSLARLKVALATATGSAGTPPRQGTARIESVVIPGATERRVTCRMSEVRPAGPERRRLRPSTTIQASGRSSKVRLPDPSVDMVFHCTTSNVVVARVKVGVARVKVGVAMPIGAMTPSGPLHAALAQRRQVRGVSMFAVAARRGNGVDAVLWMTASASTPLIPSCGYATTPGARTVAMFVGGPSGRALTSALPAKSVTGSNRSFTVPSWMVTMYVLPG